jgi:tartrate dehydratase beta subunit/fumarate hydratase class I family protein
MNDRIAIGITVDTRTIRVGDQLLFGGQAFTVRDMTALPHGGRRLDFTSGESFTMRARTVLYATRAVRPTPDTTGARSGRARPRTR